MGPAGRRHPCVPTSSKVSQMKFSYFMPSIFEGRFAKIGTVTWETMLERAQAVEALGYDGIWVGEFFETPKDIATGFPGTPPSIYAPITLMTALVMSTQRVRITSGVLVLPFHDPLVLGREMATLDHISGGRIRVGIGLGGEVEDYRRARQQLGKINRSKWLEECVVAMRNLWDEPKSSFHGEHFGFDDIEAYPKPVQSPLPVHMAGKVDAVLRRVAKHGQGWIEVTLDPDGMKSRIEQLRGYLDAEGRGGEPFEISRQFFMSLGDTDEEAETNKSDAIEYQAEPTVRKGIAQTSESGHERLLVGSVDFMRRRMHAYAEAGVTEFCVTFYEADASAAIRQLELFATRVMPEFR